MMQDSNISMVTFLCKGWLMDNKAADRHEQISKRRERKLRRLPFIFKQHHDTTLQGCRSSSGESILSNEDIMCRIFEILPCNVDKSSVAITCKAWARMFLLHLDAPKWNAEYSTQLLAEHEYGPTTVSRCNIVISKRCRCYMIDSPDSKEMLPMRQYALRQIDHLEIVQCHAGESVVQDLNAILRARRIWSTRMVDALMAKTSDREILRNLWERSNMLRRSTLLKHC